MDANPAAPAATHTGAFPSDTPPSANTGIFTLPHASPNNPTPNAGPYPGFEGDAKIGLKNT